MPGIRVPVEVSTDDDDDDDDDDDVDLVLVSSGFSRGLEVPFYGVSRHKEAPPLSSLA